MGLMNVVYGYGEDDENDEQVEEVERSSVFVKNLEIGGREGALSTYLDLMYDEENDRVWVGKYDKENHVVREVVGRDQVHNKYSLLAMGSEAVFSFDEIKIAENTEIHVNRDYATVYVNRHYVLSLVGKIVDSIDFRHTTLERLVGGLFSNAAIPDEDVEGVLNDYRERVGLGTQ